MQVSESTTSGLVHTYKVVISKTEIDQEMSLKAKARAEGTKIDGFRPGKAPLHIVMQRYGALIQEQALKDLVQKSVDWVIDSNKLKVATRPDVKLHSFDTGKDIECTISVETLPQVPEVDLSKLKVEKLEAAVEDKMIQETLDRIASQNKKTAPYDKPHKAKLGDTVIVDFNGRTEDGPISGGSGKGIALELGSGYFIPGFEEQLVGMQAKDERTIKVNFPKDYQASDLAGKEATFEVTVQEVQQTVTPQPDDEFAKGIGFEGIEKLKEFVRKTLQDQQDSYAFLLAKKELLDALDTQKVELPPSLVSHEYNSIWHQTHPEHHHEEGECPHPNDPELHKIAERRVRLGLILAEIGKKHEVAVTRDELAQALQNEARKYPGREKQVYEFYTKNSQAMNSLRAPIFEDKVIRVMLEKAQVKIKKVSCAELEKQYKNLTEDDTSE